MRLPGYEILWGCRMSPDALTQLRAYATQLDDQAPSVHELMPEQIETSGLEPVSPKTRGWVAGVMTAAAVLVLIGGAALLSALIGRGIEPIDEPPSTTAITMPQSVPDAGVEWGSVPDPAGVFAGATVESIVVGPAGLVALGNVSMGVGVWTSVDGIAWSRVPHDADIFGPGEDHVANLSAAAAGGPGIVALGSSWKEDTQTSLAWFSSDGSSWSRVPLGNPPSGTTVTEMRSVSAGGPGFVAVGWACDTGPSCDPWEPYAMVWTSADGTDWTPLANIGESFAPQTVLTEIVGYDGRLWAFGFGVGDDQDVRVWTSTDGSVWERVADDSAFGGPGNQGLGAAAAGEGGVVAAGFSWTEANGTEPVSWYSSDGSSWIRVEYNFDLIPTTTVWDMTADGAGFVAVGDLGDWGLEQGYPLGVVLSSADGITWEMINESVFDDSQLMAVSVGGPGLVAGGAALRPSARLAPIWVSPPGDLTRTEPVPPPSTSTTVLTAPIEAAGDWTRWPIEDEVFGTPAVLDVVPGGPGLVAVGAASGTCGDGLNPCSGAVWLSEDGIIWSRLDDSSQVFDASGIRAVAAGDDGLVAVGNEMFGDGVSDDPLVWFSPDGMQWSRSILPNGGQVFDVVATDTGYVAVGFAEHIQGEDIVDIGAVWISTDGITWDKTAEDLVTFADAYLMAITKTDQGLVAVGVLAQDTGFGVWTSLDGSTWTKRVVDTSFPGPGALMDVTEGTPGLIAASDSGLWLSPDGVTWQDVGDPDFRVRSVAARGDGFVAVGQTCDDTGCTTELWSSPTGITWTKEAPEPGFFDGSMTTVRATDPGLVVFSILYSGPGQAAGIGHWTWESQE